MSKFLKKLGGKAKLVYDRTLEKMSGNGNDDEEEDGKETKKEEEKSKEKEDSGQKVDKLEEKTADEPNPETETSKKKHRKKKGPSRKRRGTDSTKTFAGAFSLLRQKRIPDKEHSERRRKRKPRVKLCNEGKTVESPLAKLNENSIRRKKEHKSHENNNFDFPKDSKAQGEMTKWIDVTLDKSTPGLQKDFEAIKNHLPDVNTEAKCFLENNMTGRNRYKDVPCLDTTRVHLKHDQLNDYIHANYVNSPYIPKRFICTQAPIPLTIFHFYQMVMQEEVKVIVMICNFVESTVKKCAEYYPKTEQDAALFFGDITVTCLKSHNMDKDSAVKITVLALKNSAGQKCIVKHYHWTAWPEKGVPDVSLTAINILSSIRGSKKPIVVHCSDGVGRTGTFVAIECLLERMLKGESCENTAEVIKDIRNQRALSILTDMQYVYVHRIILHYFQDRKTIEMSQKFLEFIDDYDVMWKKYKDAPDRTPPFQPSEP